MSEPSPSTCRRDGHDRSEAWGSHSLKAMRKGPPARVMWERENRRESDAMAFGTAVHMAVFQPTLYAETYVAKPDGMSFATKDGKAWRDAHAGRHILTYVEALTVDRMRLASARKVPRGRSVDARHASGSVDLLVRFADGRTVQGAAGLPGCALPLRPEDQSLRGRRPRLSRVRGRLDAPARALPNWR